MKLIVEEFAYIDSAALFAKVADQPWSIFLDSGVIDGQPPVTKHADYDVLAIAPHTTVVTEFEQTVIKTHKSSHVTSDDPISALKKVISDLGIDWHELESAKPAYLPGSLGYFSYDLARRYEKLPEIAVDHEQLPIMAIGVYPVIVVVDHRSKKTQLISIQGIDGVEQNTKAWRSLINRQLKEPLSVEHDAQNYQNRLQVEKISENINREEYRASFDSVRDYTIAGDCYQVNLAKQFSAEVTGDAWQSYAYLRSLSPAPYGAFMNFPFAQVLSNSPESFIQCRDRHVTTSPIKGTRARNKDEERDKEIADELFHSTKDRAENLMIVDLMRNDLSKCCDDVRVPKLFAVHSFANVHHLISTITGKLRKGFDSFDLLKQCFPGGSITGAPKIRAMQIIEELEPNRRGLYCGAIAYIGADGSMETNIAIRTIVIKDDVARFSSGGGLVIDSQIDEEFQEIVDKAKMMTKALMD